MGLGFGLGLGLGIGLGLVRVGIGGVEPADTAETGAVLAESMATWPSVVQSVRRVSSHSPPPPACAWPSTPG